MQSNNLTDTLRARGLSNVTELKKVYDYGGGFGGPIKRDKLWFYTSHRWWGSQEWAAGKSYNKNQGGAIYAPDLSRQAHTTFYQQENSGRVKWQRPTSKRTFGLVDNVVTQASHFGNQQQIYDGVDAQGVGAPRGSARHGRLERRAHETALRRGGRAGSVLRQQAAISLLDEGRCLLPAALGLAGERGHPEHSGVGHL